MAAQTAIAIRPPLDNKSFTLHLNIKVKVATQGQKQGQQENKPRELGICHSLFFYFVCSVDFLQLCFVLLYFCFVCFFLFFCWQLIRIKGIDKGMQSSKDTSRSGHCAL